MTHVDIFMAIVTSLFWGSCLCWRNWTVCQERRSNAGSTRQVLWETSTYPLQRTDINRGTSIRNLKVQWPYLFNARSLQSHARELLDVDVREAICNAYKTKASRLNSFFRSSSVKSKNSKCSMYFEEAVIQSNMDNLKSWLMAVVLCIMDHFGEKEEDLFHVVDVCIYNHDNILNNKRNATLKKM